MPTLDIESTRWELEYEENGEWTTILRSQDDAHARQAYQDMKENCDCPTRLMKTERTLVTSHYPAQ